MNTEELQQLETVEVLTGQPVSTSVIWLHGLGADGHDFVNFIPELKLPAQKGIRFIFPHAPKRPITINQGMRMRAWYNVTSLSRLEDDLIGIQQSIQQVSQLILQQEELGISSERIILVGFSQGGAIALHAALSYPRLLGGVLGLSTYLPAPNRILPADDNKAKLPIMMLHGEYDTVIPLNLAKLGYDFLINQGYQVDWHQYAMAHQICVPEINDIQKWLLARLN